MSTNDLSPTVLKLKALCVNKLTTAMKGGTAASICVAAMLIADDELNGSNAIGRRKLMASIRQTMLNRGEKKGSFEVYARIGASIVVNFRAEVLGAVRNLKNQRRNEPMSATEVYEAVFNALTIIPELMGSFTQLREATIGTGGTSGKTDDEKARAKVRSLVTAINKLDDTAALMELARLASLRRAALTGAPGLDRDKVIAEAEECLKAMLAAYAAEQVPAVDEADELDEAA